MPMRSARGSHRMSMASQDRLSVEQFAGGQSNPTFKLITPARSYVMRSKPGPAAKLLQSAHAIEREYRVMDALAGTDVPVAKMFALCEDESVIGRAFYVMEFIEGRVLWDQSLPGMTPAERGAIYDEMNRVIAALHSVDVGALGLADYGKPGNYFERQIGRWSKQYVASETEPIESMNKLIEWLPKHIPRGSPEASERASIVHGDYRLDNLIFHPTEPRVLAVLDWELSTLGDPLADFAYHCMAWHVDPSQFRGIAGLDWAALGIPDEAAYVATVLRAHRPHDRRRLELLSRLQHVPHRRDPAGNHEARDGGNGVERASGGRRPARETDGRACLGLCAESPRLSSPRQRSLKRGNA